MVISKLSAKCSEFLDLFIFILGSFCVGLSAGILGAEGDSFVGLWAVGVGRYCEVIGDSELDESNLYEEGAGENDEPGLIFSIDPYFFHEFVVDAFAVAVTGWLFLHV